MKYLLKTSILTAIILLSLNIFAQKRAMTIDDLKIWNTVKEQGISPDGNFVSYVIKPNKGDANLYLFDAKKKSQKKFERGYSSKLGFDNNLLIFKIKVEEDSLRKKKIDKVKKDKLPKDSLGIYVFEKDTIIKIEKIKNYFLPKKSSKWLAYLYDFKEEEIKDTTEIAKDSLSLEIKEEEKEEEKKDKPKEYKQEGKRLVILNTLDLSTYVFENVEYVAFSEKGEKFSFIVNKKDSIDTAFVYLFDTKLAKEKLIFEKQGKALALTTSNKGFKTAFLFSSDTIDEKKYTLIYKNQNEEAIVLVDTISENFRQDWGVSKNKIPFFTDEGNLLYFGIAKLPKPIPEDTLLENEKVYVDVWNWKDKRLQPQQLAELEKDKKKTFLSFYNVTSQKIIQLEDSLISVSVSKREEPLYYIGKSYLPYLEIISWDMSYFADYYVINAKTGERKLIDKKKAWTTKTSPKGKFTLLWENEKECWKLIDNQTLKSLNLTEDVADIFVNDEQDTPSLRRSHHSIGWSEGEKSVFINSKYDIWEFSTENISIATNLTQGEGRLNNIKYRFRDLDYNETYLPSDKWLLHSFNRKTMVEGFESLNLKNLRRRILTKKDNNFSYPVKAENAKKLIWSQSNFAEFPDLRLSDLEFKNVTKISDANPQQNKINWGTKSLTYWSDFRGDTLRGMIFLPENFDKNKKYPVIMYFYEKYSERYNTYWTPNPSRSIINFPFYVSNEYIVFVPDINYTTGLPGKDAYNAIVSGTQHISNLPYIDKTKIAIQGQSWGGYQVAYLITQTNLYACAMGGAVVSNMTSAYGGIRWKSGLSRMFQYEHTQSRIGGTLWEKRDKYIENSPVFFADRVETPLLLMHNDADGSVPWYQGIEYFVALRRLQKPVWMLNYNGDDHNLRKWPNRIDLSIRMFQFFEHYLKGAEEPKWMKIGIPAIKKGEIND